MAGEMLAITVEQGPALFEAFLQDRAGAIADTTAATYARKLTAFHRWWQVYEPTLCVSETLATRYARWLATEGAASKASQALHLSAVRQWGCFLLAAGHVTANPFSAVAGPPRARWLRHRLLTRTDLQAVLTHFSSTTLGGQRDYLLAALMIRTGARESELAAATLGDLTDYGEEGSLLFLHSKGKAKQEPVVVRPDLSKKLWSYLRRRYPDGRFPPHDPLFVNHHLQAHGEPMTTRGMRKRLKAGLTDAGLDQPHVTALSLRLSGGALAYRKGASPSEIKKTMRHESLQTTQVLIDQVNRIRFGAERYLDDIQ